MTKRPSVVRRLGITTFAALFLSQTVGIPVATAAPSPTNPPPYPTTAIVESGAKIYLPGGGGVSDAGTASYSIPLWVPDGPRGMQPSLSISYGGSTSSNGLLGVGFQLGGLSAIQPCAKTVASEGFTDGVDLGLGNGDGGVGDVNGGTDDAPDAYCLDGQKLVPFVDPAFPLPPSGFPRTYHTEVETFVHVVETRTSATAAQPAAFQVYLPSGRVRTYRPRAAARYKNEHATSTPVPYGPSVSVVYLLEEEKDVDRNAVRYVYESTDAAPGELAFRIKQIDYSFAGTTTPRRHIKFFYRSRVDPQIRYVRGVKIVTRSLLDRIEAWAPNPTTTQQVWRYQLGYAASADTARSLLQEITLHTYGGSQSWTRRFEWTGTHGLDIDERAIGPAEFDDVALGSNPFLWTSWRDAEHPQRNWPRPQDSRLILYDADGDGDDDALYRLAPSWILMIPFFGEEGLLDRFEIHSSLGQIQYRMSSADTPVGFQQYSVNFVLEPGFDAGPPGLGESSSFAHLAKSRVADVNGDGQLDLVLARTRMDGTGQVPAGNGTGQWDSDTWQYGFRTIYGRPFDHFTEYPFEPSQPPYALGTHDLDPVQMFGPIVRSDAHAAKLMQTRPSFQQIIADLDGDARVEQVSAIGDPIDILGYPDTNFDDPNASAEEGFPYQTTLSTDGSWQPFEQAWVCGNGRAQVVDVDVDGRQEVLIASQETGSTDTLTGDLALYRALAFTDSSSQPHGQPILKDLSRLWSGGCFSSPDLVFGDFNGDGLADALYPPGSYRMVADHTELNTLPIVRWNLGTGFGPAQELQVGGVSADAMRQDAPMGYHNHQAAWDRGTRVADVDGDGRSDIVAFRQNNAACVDPVVAGTAAANHSCEQKLIVFRSLGDRFFGEEMFTWPDGLAHVVDGFSMSQLGDVTGDGAIDAVTIAGNRMRVVELPWRSTPDRLVKVRDDGVAYALETFTYDRAWWGDAPRAEADNLSPMGPGPCAWPIACPKRGFEVVRAHQVFAGTRPDGTAMHRTTYHKYRDPRVSLIGGGSLGFGSHLIWDRETGTGTERIFDQNAVDASPGTPGGTFYPGTRAPHLVVTVTPRSPMPSDAELATTSTTPGLAGASTDVRTHWYSRQDDLTYASANRILTILPRAVTVDDVENTATPQTGTGTPSWIGATWTGNGSETVTRYEHDAYGSPTKVKTEIWGGIGTPRATRETTTTYRHLPAKWRLGLPTRIAQASYDFDDAFHPERVIRADYDASGRSTTAWVNAVGPTHAACVAGGGSVEACEDKSTMVMFTTRDAYGNPTTDLTMAAGDPVPRVGRATYDAEGVYAVSSTDALGFWTIALHHPAYGVPVVEIDAVGNTRTTRYDGFGRVFDAQQPGAATVTRSTTEYASGARRGFRFETTAADGSKEVEIVDELGRTIATELKGFDGQTIYTRRSYDPAGNAIAASEPSLSPNPPHVSIATYDRLGNALLRMSPDGASSLYDPGLLESTAFDPESHETYVLRDAMGRVIESGHRVGVNGEPEGEVHFSYGPFDQIDQVVDASGNVTTIDHDGFGRVVREVDPDAGETRYDYTGYGEIKRQQNANGDVVDRRYDLLGRLTTTIGPDGTSTLAYDTGLGAARKLVKATSFDGVVTDLTYDAYGRSHQVSQTEAGVTRTVVRRYDGFGRIKHLFYPETPGFDRFTVSHIWNANGYLSTLRDTSICHYPTAWNASDPACVNPPLLWEATTRDARLALTASKFGSNQTVTRAYDAATGRQTQLTAAGVTTHYGYNGDGLLISRDEPVTNRSEDFTYDDLHRLAGWDLVGGKGGPAADIHPTFEYDELGNLLKVVDDGTTVFSGTYGVSGRPHALASSSTGGSFTYDDKGRQIAGASRTITWNQLDKPEKIDAGPRTRFYSYDGFGERATREDAVGKVVYLGDLYESRQTIASGRTDVFYVAGDPGTVAQVEQGPSGKTTRYVVGDPLGSAVQVQSSAGAILERPYFAPFGGRLSSTGVSTADPVRATTFGFTGAEEDDDDPVGLVNLRGRIYDRGQYRFLSPDPVVGDPYFGQAYNPYSYVYNNPLNLVDPTGYTPEPNDGGYDPSQDDWTEDGGGYKVRSDGEIVFETDTVYGWPPVATDSPPPAPPAPPKPNGPPKAAKAPEVKRLDTWLPERKTAEVTEQMFRIAGDNELAMHERVAAYALGSLGTVGLAHDYVTDAVLSFVQAPAIGAIETGEHIGRAIVLAQNGSAGDYAVTLEVLRAGQSGAMTLADTADVVLMVSPSGAAKTAGKAAVTISEEGFAALLKKAFSGRWTTRPTNAHRGEVWARQDGICPGCGHKMTMKPGPRQLNLDHKRPYKTHGPSHPLDAQGLCRTCNLDKGDMPLHEWIWYTVTDELKL